MTGHTEPADRLTRAVALACEVHRNDSRTVAHLLGAASLVLDESGDEEEAIAAVLHPTLENDGAATDEALARVRADFGDRLAELVAACNDIDAGGPSAATWSVRKQHTIDALHGADAAAARVIIAGNLHAVRRLLTDLADHGPQLWDRFDAGRDDQLWYYAALSEVAQVRRRGGSLTREFARAVEQLERAAYAASAPKSPSDWDAAAVAQPCGARSYLGRRCRRAAGHAGLHAVSPRPGDR